MRLTLRPLNPDGVRLIKDVDRVLPAFAVTEHELDVYVADRRELERVLTDLTPQWPQLVEVELARPEAGSDPWQL